MRGAGGHVKLMDFGLAKSLEGGAKSTVISGTPSYMAPEQLTGKGVDPRTDLFAIGATLYEMVTGDVPFHGMVRVEAPVSMRQALPAVPMLLDQLVMRSLEFDKERRCASAADMLAQVREVLAEIDPKGRESAAIAVRAKGAGAPGHSVGSLRASSIPREEPASSGDAPQISLKGSGLQAPSARTPPPSREDKTVDPGAEALSALSLAPDAEGD